MNKEEWEDYKNLSSQITEKLDNTSTYESWLIIQEYIDRCQQENQSLKDIMKQAIEILECSENIFAQRALQILKGDKQC